MIYTDSQLKEKIVRMIESFENEVVEFKEARTNYSFNDIGKYFSALSNEANLRGLQEAWLIFGISDDKRYVGTEFRKQGSLQSLKKEIVNGTNERLTFLEIYELTMEKCRVIAFQIPPAIRGIPTTWQGAAYAREHESISPLPMNKVDLLRSQIGMDWSKEIVEDATIEAKDENLNYEKELNAQLTKLKKMRQKYMDMYTDDLITREELNEKIGGTKQEIERLENELKMVAYHLTKGEQLETILNRTFKEIEDISDVHQMTNAQLKRIIQKIEVDKDGNVDIYLRIFGDLGLDETVLISDNQT